MATPALAGDRSLIDFIGYSEDGRYFAFEEFGVQDGSGFAYSNIYVVDLPADKWVAGSPFRVMADDASWDRPLTEIRAEAMGKAGDALVDLKISVPADILALIGDGVPDEAGKDLEFSWPSWGPPGSTEEGGKALHLSTFDADSPEDCVAYIGHSAKGYALSYEYEPGKSSELHRDTVLPASRGCTLDYRLYAVVQPFEGQGGGAPVAIISSYPFGFEGPDRRFLAIPLIP